MKKGFTLIELLVVVLIIGILAAIALPQYSAAVEKSRITEAVVLGKAIKDAQEIYFMEHGAYTTSFEDLSIELPNKGSSAVTDSVTTGKYKLQLYSDGFVFILPKDKSIATADYWVDICYSNSACLGGINDMATCAATATNKKGIKICRSIGQADVTRSSDTSNGWVRYRI